MAKVARADVGTIILPTPVSDEILRGVAETSLIQSLARSRPMTTNAVTLREAEVGAANAFWVGEGQRKQTDAPTVSQLAWTLTSAELAVIIPIDEAVTDDADVDLFALYKPQIESAIAAKLDTAALFGQDAPTAWGAVATGVHIVPDAVLASHFFEEDGSPTDAELLDLINGTGAVPGTPDGAIQAIEEDQYVPNLILAYNRFKARLRNMKDADGRYMFGDAATGRTPTQLSDVPIKYTTHNQGSDIWLPADAHLIVGDWAQAILGTRQGIKYKAFDQGVITDGAGNVVYSLMEQDMTALRVTARYAFKVICDESADGDTISAGDAYPFAVVGPAQ